MLFKKYDPLKNKTLQVLDLDGNIIDKSLEPDIDNDTLIHLYKTMLQARLLDTKALQYQRQGRIYTYIPNKGQEASQVGSAAATKDTDWIVPAFRELGTWIYKGVSMEQILLYYYGNERGSEVPEHIKMLPVSIVIGAQLSHAVGIAMASKYQELDEVTLTYIGEGGTSEGEFHEALNFANVFNAPTVFVVQNNQYAISVPRKKQTKSETIAQKAVAYGMPGIQVDGNDLLAVYIATQEAVERARKGEGPSLIENVTYRLGPHTSSDDPTLYRENEEVDEWLKKEPIGRFKKYLMNKGIWDEDKDEAFIKETNEKINKEFKKVEATGTMPLEDIFMYHFEELPLHLRKQYEDYKEYLREEVTK